MSMDANDTPLTQDPSRVANLEVMRGLLRGNPEWLRSDPQLLADLGLRLDAANIVDFGPVALSRVSAAHQRKSSARKRLETMARANFAAQTQTHAAVIDVLKSDSLVNLAERVDQLARLRFGLAIGGLAMEGGETPSGWVTLWRDKRTSFSAKEFMRGLVVSPLPPVYSGASPPSSRAPRSRG